MSSNTLRGIGQEGDGEGERESVPAPVKIDASTGTSDEPGGKPTSRLKDFQEVRPDPRRARSLDATVPPPRSLDSSVPDAQPSLDAKIPALASTLMGVTAPVVGSGGRDMGTVQGRDVHLPVEVQRLAGVRAIVSNGGAAAGEKAPRDISGVPVAVERSEPTIADPVLTDGVSQQRIETPRTQHADLHSHSPWYDQEPASGDVYEETKPSTVGRVAMGVAVAAALSVMVFAIMRLYAQNAAADAIEPPSKPTEAYTRPSPPPEAPAAGVDVSRVPPSIPATPPVPTARQLPAKIPGGEPPGDSAPAFPDDGDIGTAPTTPHAATRAVVSSSQPGKPTTPRPLSQPRAGVPVSLPAPVHAAIPAPPEPPAPSIANALPPPPRLPSEIAPPVTAPAKPAASPDRPRAKPTYDPDSTLPLNLE